GSIQEGRSPRYLIRADSRLKPDQVVFWFGNGIYFPRLGEPPELYVGLELDGLIIAPPTLSGIMSDHAATNVNNVGITQLIATVNYAMGFYADQGRLLLTAEGYGINQVPGWVAGESAYLLVRRAADNKFVADFLGDKTQFITSSRYDYNKGWSLGIAPQKGQNGQRLIVSLCPVKVGDDDGNTTVAGSNAGAPSMHIDDDPNTPVFYRLELRAIALQRLVNNLQQWTIWLDDSGSLAKPDDIEYSPNTLTQLCLNGAGLWIIGPSMVFENGNATPIAVKRQLIGKIVDKEIKIGNLDAYLLPPINAGSPGLLKIKSEFITLGPDVYTIGRRDPNGDAPNKLVLDHLAQPKAMLWSNKATQDAKDTVGNINFSRNHATIQIENQHLRVESLSKLGVLHLDKDGNHLGKVVNDGETLQVKAGEHILVGSHVLKLVQANATINNHGAEAHTTADEEIKYFPVNID
ncbi:hypothetical protein TI04_04400, partial [Achromatium sp. WMS2]